MSKTTENLKAAFAGESQANRRYLAYAKQAEEEGYPQVARLFRAVAAAETIHAHSHLRVLGEIKSTLENLREAAGGENYEVHKMYPPFIEEAKAEDNAKAVRSFTHAMEVEKGHEELYLAAMETLGKEEEEYDYYVCPVCGHTHPRNAPEKCPVCGAPASRFERIH